MPGCPGTGSTTTATAGTRILWPGIAHGVAGIPAAARALRAGSLNCIDTLRGYLSATDSASPAAA
jgi:hypothetical protein